jgi:hypothetical protein
MTEELLRPYPAWREGLRRFIVAGFEPGVMILHTWFFAAFDIEEPNADTPFGSAEKAKLAYLGAIERLKAELLATHQIALDSVPGRGYQVVPAGEQTAWAEKEGVAELKTALRKMAGRMTCVDLDKLSSDQRAENADALARLSFLAGAVKQVKKHGGLGALRKRIE